MNGTEPAEKKSKKESDQTDRILPVPPHPLSVLETLEAAGYPSYLVGGCVRDALQGMKPKDYDITTAAPWQRVEELFSHTARTGIRHGTLTILVENEPIEVTTMRKESGYSDHRHPDTIEYTDQIEEDLARRDFTINAIAYSPACGIVDPYGGQDDLKKKIIRAVGDPDRRFEEDALRMFRAFRFAGRLGAIMDPATRAAIARKAPLCQTLAVERVTKELEEILACSPEIIADMLELLNGFLPELAEMKKTPQNTPYHYTDVLGHTLDALAVLSDRSPVLLWALLLHDVGKIDARTTDEKGIDHFKRHELASLKRAKPILESLRLPKKLIHDALMLIRDHDTFYAPRLENLYKLRVVKGYDDELVQKLFALQEADIRAHRMQERMESLRRFQAFYEVEKDRHPFHVRDLKINGRDVAERTDLQAKERKEALDEVLHRVIVDKGLDSREAQLALLDQIARRICRQRKKN